MAALVATERAAAGSHRRWRRSQSSRCRCRRGGCRVCAIASPYRRDRHRHHQQLHLRRRLMLLRRRRLSPLCSRLRPEVKIKKFIIV